MKRHGLAFLVCLFALSPVAAQDEPAGTLADAQAHIQKQEFRQAADILRALTKRDPENGQAWFFLGYALHALGDLDAAIPAHLKAAEFPQSAPTALYNAACAYALQKKSDLAFDYLAKARAAGFNNPQQLRIDTDLDSIRKDPRFAEFLPELKKVKAPFVETDTEILLTLTGENAGDQFGWVAANVGDTNGDRLNDILVGAPFFKFDGQQVGRAYLYSGSDGELLRIITGDEGVLMGMSVSAAGDVDGDGRADYAVGAPGPQTGPGRVHVFSGKDHAKLLTLEGEGAGDRFGREIGDLGDFNGDGHDDLIIGAPGHDGVGEDSGRAYVISGKDGSFLHTLSGKTAGDLFGSAVAGASGRHPRLAIGAMGAGEGDRGRVYIYSGSTPQLAFTVEADESGKNLGRFFLSFGDVNNDGFPDAYCVDFENTAQGPNSGRVYVHSGKDGAKLLEFTGKSGEGLGIGNAQAGDVDRDGHADLVVGAWLHASAAPQGGRIYVYSGKDGRVLRTITGTQPGDTFGFDATGIGDLDGDGEIDFLVTSAWNSAAGAKAGRVYVIAGQPIEKGGW